MVIKIVYFLIYTDQKTVMEPRSTKIFLEKFETFIELLSGLKEYFEFYNFERPHQSLARKTPAEKYWGRDVVKKTA